MPFESALAPLARASNEYSDEHAHSRSLARAFAARTGDEASDHELKPLAWKKCMIVQGVTLCIYEINDSFVTSLDQNEMRTSRKSQLVI